MGCIAIDFDGTIVSQDRPYDDVTTPLEFLVDPVTGYSSRDGLLALKAAGHLLVLSSCRANRALTVDQHLDPLVRAGKRPADPDWERRRGLNQRRLQQMLDFVDAELPGVFDAIDDGTVGKITADMFLDDRAIRMIRGPGALRWDEVARLWGEQPPPPAAPTEAREP